MTDRQIFENEIKCITRRNECVCNGGSDCIKCDLLMDSEEIVKCYNRAIKNVDLMNRQKVEIENLKVELKVMRGAANSYKMAYEKLKKTPYEMQVEVSDKIEKQIKSEAIKEFAERLKIKVKMYNSEDVNEGDLIDDHLTVGETAEIIDNLVKEMKRGCK